MDTTSLSELNKPSAKVPAILLQTPPDTPIDNLQVRKAGNGMHSHEAAASLTSTASLSASAETTQKSTFASSTSIKSSASYKSSANVSISISEEQKRLLYQGASSFGDILSQVPWMKFRLIAEPNVDTFASDIRLQAFIRQITELTVSVVTKQCSEQIAVLVAALVTSMSNSMTARVSLIQETIIEQIAALTLADTMTKQNQLKIIDNQFCVGPIHKPIGPPVYVPGRLDITKANWIWTEEVTYKKRGQPYFTRPFRKVVKCEDYVDRLAIAIACADRYTLYVNGRLVGSGDDHTTPARYAVEFEASKSVVIAVYASDDTGGTAIGLLACGKVWNSHDGKEITFLTDKSWKTHPGSCNKTFVQVDYKDAATWDHAYIVATYEGASWKSDMKEVQKGKMVHHRWSGRMNIADAPEAQLAKLIE